MNAVFNAFKFLNDEEEEEEEDEEDEEEEETTGWVANASTVSEPGCSRPSLFHVSSFAPPAPPGPAPV